MFLRYDCGCIGFGSIEIGNPYVVKPCDLAADDHHAISIGPRSDLAQKGREKVRSQEVVDLLREISDLVHDGYKLRDVKHLLA